MEDNMLDKEFKDLVLYAKQDILKTRYEVQENANMELIKLYFRLGKIVSENAKYGNKFVNDFSIAFLYKILKELKKENKEYIDYYLIKKLESNHIRTNLEYNGITIHVRSLKEYIDEDFKLFAIEEKKYLKLCKHCGKAFTAPNPKTEYDTFSCKNQENVYKSRARNKE